MPGLAYPTDFVGKLELFEFIDKECGIREEHWLSDTALIKCIWFETNLTEVPSTILYKHYDNPLSKEALF